MKRAALLLLLLTACIQYDMLGWEGVISFSAVVPAHEPDSMWVLVRATGESFAIGSGESLCVSFPWKANRTARFNVTTLREPLHVVDWRSPTEAWPHLVYTVAGDGLETHYARRGCA